MSLPPARLAPLMAPALVATVLASSLASPAHASVIAFEDDAVLGVNQWQLNAVLTVAPLSQRVDGFAVSALAAPEAAIAGQFCQEICYGLTDRVRLRTTLPVSGLRDAAGGMQVGMADAELFLKTSLASAESPLNASLGMQAFFPTGAPSGFALNGSMNLIPCLMLRATTDLGSFLATGGYQVGLDRYEAGQRLHPADVLLYALGWHADLSPDVNLALELLGSEGRSSLRDGVPEPGTEARQVSLAPGVTWKLGSRLELLGSVQVPLLRQGSMAASPPVTGLIQVTLNL